MSDGADPKWDFLPISFPCVYERGADRLKPSKGEVVAFQDDDYYLYLDDDDAFYDALDVDLDE